MSKQEGVTSGYDPARAGYDQGSSVSPAPPGYTPGYTQGGQMAAPTPVQYMQPGGNPQTIYTNYNAPLVIASPGDPDISRLRNYNIVVIVMSFLATFLCCNLVCGIPAIILAFFGREDYNMGRKETGKVKTAISLALSLTAMLVIIGLLTWAGIHAANAYNKQYNDNTWSNSWNY